MFFYFLYGFHANIKTLLRYLGPIFLNSIPSEVIFFLLILLVICSAFFSGSETGLMSLNRFKLKHLSKKDHKGAKRASKLLERPDRLIGVILLGNNFVNVLASALATILAIRIWGDEMGIPIATFALTLVILIFSEVTPKTLAALHPERVAFLSSFILQYLLKALYPLVWLVNFIANGILAIFNIHLSKKQGQSLSRDELRTVVKETAIMIPMRHQQMLVNILDLEAVTVNDIMIPRNEIFGIDLDDEWDDIIELLNHSMFTRIPIYQQDINKVCGILHMRKIINKLATGNFTRQDLEESMRKPYFVPEDTPLTTQLANFQRQKRRIGFIVDEYGDILGMVTLEDILEEIVGEFTTDPSSTQKDIFPQDDGSYLADGSTNIRDLIKLLDWEIPLDGPKTLNGLILEHMQTIPGAGTTLLLFGRPVEIIQLQSNAVKMVRIQPKLKE